MAKQGFPRMGISACFGGPFFIILLKINAVKTFFSKIYLPFIFIKDLSDLSYFLLSDLCTEIYCRICDEVIKSHDIGAALRSVGMETIF